MVEVPGSHSGWTFVTNHARVLAATADNPNIRIRDIAAHCRLTERAVQRIISDLEQDGLPLPHPRRPHQHLPHRSGQGPAPSGGSRSDRGRAALPACAGRDRPRKRARQPLLPPFRYQRPIVEADQTPITASAFNQRNRPWSGRGPAPAVPRSSGPTAVDREGAAQPDDEARKTVLPTASVTCCGAGSRAR